MQTVSGGDECSSTEVACGDLLTEVVRFNQVENQVRVYEVCLVLLTKLLVAIKLGIKLGVCGVVDVLNLLTEVNCWQSSSESGDCTLDFLYHFIIQLHFIT